MNRCFVGVDTSNYTTSVGLVDENGRVLANVRRLLPVGEGKCGLRQSDAVFAHIKQLPVVFDEAAKALGDRIPAAVGCSVKPRNAEKSYMPCFLCGEAAAHAFAAARSLPVYAYSHQCGHLAAALLSQNAWEITKETFLAFHVSGGTTEILKCTSGHCGFDTEVIGGTMDLSAGQAIDRAGVMMGMPFPSGRMLEAAANEFSGKFPYAKISTDGLHCNFSGLQNLSEKLYRESKSQEMTSAFVLDFIGRTLLEMARAARERFGSLPILFGGGVMSNQRLRAVLAPLGKTYFAEPVLAADNAVGIAELARRTYQQREEA